MAISTTFTWSIRNCTRDTSDGFITDAIAVQTGVAKSDGVGIATYAMERTAGFGTVRPDPMIAYADVTEANVISWSQTSIGSTDVALMQENINVGLANLYNPTPPAQSSGVPW